MSGQEALNCFVSKVENIPHIANNVLGYMDVTDIANILRTSKALRKFLLDAMNNIKQLQHEFDAAVIDHCCLRRPWKRSDAFSVPADESVSHKFRERMFCLNNCLWFSADNRAFSTKQRMMTRMLIIHDLDRSSSSSIKVDKIPQMEVLANGSVLLDDGLQVRIINHKDGKTNEKMVHQRPKGEKERFPNSSDMARHNYVGLLSRYCIYGHVDQGKEQEYLQLFNHEDGLPCKPIYLHQVLEEMLSHRSYNHLRPKDSLVVPHKQVTNQLCNNLY